MTRSWFEIKAAKTSAEVYLYDEIGLFGVPASQFVNEIRNLKGKTLNVYVNSPGGNAFDGIAIYNSLKRHDGTVNMTVDGLAASAASFIVQAGDSRTMAKASTMMIHDAWGIAMGPQDEMEKMAGELELHSNSVAGIYAERAGGTAAEWRERMKAETWYNAYSAVEAKLADAFYAGDSAPKASAALAGRIFNLSKYKNVPENVQKANAANALSNTQFGTITSSFSSNDIPSGGGVLFADAGGLKWKGSGGTITDMTVNANPPSNPPTPAVQDGMEVKDMTELTPESRRILGIDEDGDINQAIQVLNTRAQDIATGEKGAENTLRKDNAQLRQQILTVESEYGQRILALEDRNRQKEAEWTVDTAIQQGRVAPKDRDIALKLALNDADGFAQFAANLRVDLNERGMAMDANMAAIEPNAEEMDAARQLGLSKEAIMAQKAKNQDIPLPA